MNDPHAMSAALPPNTPMNRSSWGRLARWAVPPALMLVALLMATPAGAVSLSSSAPTAHAPLAVMPAPSAPPSASPGPGALALPAHAGLSGALGALPARLPGYAYPAAPALGGAAGFGPAAAAPSTASNFFVTNYSYTTSLSQVGTSNNLSLIAGVDTYYDILNGTSSLGYPTGYAFSKLFWTHGLLAGGRSTNGGKSWSFSWPGANASWTTSGNPSYGDINVGQAVVATNASGSVVLMASVFGQPCFEFGASPSACNSTANITAPSGISVARSTDGGKVWSKVAVVASIPDPYKYAVISISPCSPLAVYLNGNYSIGSPQLAFNPTNGHGVVTWTFVKWSYAGDIICSAGSYYLSHALIPEVFVESSYTTDSGLTWSAPQVRSNNNSVFASQAIGPTPQDKNFMVFSDYNNQSSTGVSVDEATSVTNGTSWSVAAGISGFYQIPVQGIGNAAGVAGFPVASPPFSMAYDVNATSPYRGSLYLAYSDNRSFTSGEPSIAFLRSTNGGSAWTAPIFLTPNSVSTQYAIPNLAIEPSGRIWVSFYAVTASTGTYYEMGVTSNDGGATWSAPFYISDAMSQATPGRLFGNLAGLVGTTAGAYATWADCRAGACPTSDDQYVFAANLHVVPVQSNIAGVSMSLTTLGHASTVALNGSVVLENGAEVTAQVPTWVSDASNPNYVYAFSNFSGVASSPNDPATFVYSGNGTIRANYAQVPAAWITGYISPNVAQIAVSVNGVAEPLSTHNATSLSFNATVEAGPAYVVAISGGVYYVSNTTVVPTSAFTVYRVDRVLARTHGWIQGTVTPTGGSVTVNGTAVTVTGGLFNISEAWGLYVVNGSLTGFTNFSSSVTVTPSHTTGVSVVLSGARIGGQVTPVSAAVQVDGVPVTVNAAGNFETGPIPGGTHLVTATAAGYSMYRRDVTVAAGATASVTIVLSNQGWINGTVKPATALVQIGAQFYRVSSAGGFNVTLLGGHTYAVKATLSGYYASTQNITVTPGNVSRVNFTLTQIPPTCPGSPGCPGGGHNNSSVQPAQTNWLLYGGIAAVIIVVAALAVLMLMRRRGGASSAPAEGGTGEAGDAGEGSEAAAEGGGPPSSG